MRIRRESEEAPSTWRKEAVMDDERLKACPFCGGDASVKQHYIVQKKAMYKIGCDACGFALNWCERKSHAIKLWNRRAPKEESEQ